MKPEHYKVISVSIYSGDLEHLDDIVVQLKHKGFTKANRSAVIREALRQMDPDRVRRGM